MLRIVAVICVVFINTAYAEDEMTGCPVVNSAEDDQCQYIEKANKHLTTQCIPITEGDKTGYCNIRAGYGSTKRGDAEGDPPKIDDKKCKKATGSCKGTCGEFSKYLDTTSYEFVRGDEYNCEVPVHNEKGEPVKGFIKTCLCAANIAAVSEYCDLATRKKTVKDKFDECSTLKSTPSLKGFCNTRTGDCGFNQILVDDATYQSKPPPTLDSSICKKNDAFCATACTNYKKSQPKLDFGKSQAYTCWMPIYTHKDNKPTNRTRRVCACTAVAEKND